MRAWLEAGRRNDLDLDDLPRGVDDAVEGLATKDTVPQQLVDGSVANHQLADTAAASNFLLLCAVLREPRRARASLRAGAWAGSPPQPSERRPRR